MVNNGLIVANVSQLALVLDPPNVADAFVNSSAGILRASNGGILQLTANGGGDLRNNGVFEVLDGSTISLAAYTLSNFSDGILTGGTYRVLSAGAPTTLDFGFGSIAANAATIELQGADSAFPQLAGLAANQGSLKIAGGRNFLTSGALLNTGKIEIGANSTLSISGNFASTAASTITGSGKITANFLNLAGIIAPGNSPGTISFEGDVELFPSTRLVFELGAPLGIHDQLSIDGSLKLDGSLEVSALPGFGVGEYQLATYSGTLADFVLDFSSMPGGYDYQIRTVTPGQVVLSVAVPEPSGLLLSLLGALQALSRRNRSVSRQKIRS